jgi:hypothetical protein
MGLPAVFCLTERAAEKRNQKLPACIAWYLPALAKAIVAGSLTA